VKEEEIATLVWRRKESRRLCDECSKKLGVRVEGHVQNMCTVKLDGEKLLGPYLKTEQTTWTLTVRF